MLGSIIPALLCALWLAGAGAAAGAPDTLRNHEPSAPLSLLRYGPDVGSGKGLLLGHNSLYRQQYAEKYGMGGRGRVLGVLARLGGVVANGDHKAVFSLYQVAPGGLPGTRLDSVEVRYQDLDLSGAPMTIPFRAAIPVEDSFFVAFSLGDYAHGGYEGDTLGLYACAPGCRTGQDLELYGRNVVQWHNHDKLDWHDLYYQNFTPVAIHLALYPLLESSPSALGSSGKYTAWAASVRHRSGNGLIVSLQYHLERDDALRCRLYDLRGREVFRNDALRLPAGTGRNEIHIRHSPPGTYLLRLQGRSQTETRKVVVP